MKEKTINYWREIKTMIQMIVGCFRTQKLMLSFEYGVILSQVAKDRGVELTPEIVRKAEEVLLDAFCRYTPTQLAVEMEPIILSILETDMGK